MRKTTAAMLLALLFLVPIAFAEGDISTITAPLDKIYDLVKAIVSVVAVIAITIAGARFMFSGDDIKQREASKTMVGYCVIGLVVVWIAPLMVNYLTAPI